MPICPPLIWFDNLKKHIVNSWNLSIMIHTYDVTENRKYVDG